MTPRIAYVNSPYLLRSSGVYRDGVNRSEPSQWFVVAGQADVVTNADGTANVIPAAEGSLVIVAYTPHEAIAFAFHVLPEVAVEYQPPPPDRLGGVIEVVKANNLP